MTALPQCSDCKHQMARKMCGCPESPLYRKTTEPKDHCGQFVSDPARVLYMEAVLLALATNRAEAGLSRLEEALALGLPEDDEIAARFMVGEAFKERIANADTPAAELGPDHPEVRRALDEIERAAVIDRNGAYGYFEQALNRARLQQPDYLYKLVAVNVANSAGDAAALQFADRALATFDYLRTPPLLNLLEWKAALLDRTGRKEEAIRSLRAILTAEPVTREDGDGQEAVLRARAQAQLNDRQKSVAVAVLLSFIFPGGGQFYNGQSKKGLLVLLTFWLTVPYIWSWFDAFMSARRINRALQPRD